jgi:hypothetical protein
VTFFAVPWIKEFAATADQCVGRHTGGGPNTWKEPLMSVLMSWARSTLANVEYALGRSDRLFDRILAGVLVLLALAIVLLFVAT